MKDIEIIGHLGADPETKYTKEGSMYVTFSVGVTEYAYGGKQPDTYWFRVTFWNKIAETMDKLAQDGHLKKGKQVFVRGDYSFETYTTQNGVSGSTHKINGNKLQLLGKKDD